MRKEASGSSPAAAHGGKERFHEGRAQPQSAWEQYSSKVMLEDIITNPFEHTK